jgi:predicted anti-sigma-YlaC factor YlaD
MRQGGGMNQNQEVSCAELEILLCDYFDGTLTSSARLDVEAHIASCPACEELASSVKAAMGLIERAAVVQPPAELLTRILHEIPGRDLAAENSFWRRLRSGWLKPVLQPRYAMGMAMTILSFSLLAKFAGFEPRQLRAADLDPMKVLSTVDDRAHRTWDRAVKYYENLRLVIVVQSRLKEISDQQEQRQQQTAPNSTKSSGVSDSGRREKK